MSRLLAAVGLIFMLHAAVSIGQYRGIMRERGDDNFSIPFDILAEVSRNDVSFDTHNIVSDLLSFDTYFSALLGYSWQLMGGHKNSRPIR